MVRNQRWPKNLLKFLKEPGTKNRNFFEKTKIRLQVLQEPKSRTKNKELLKEPNSTENQE